MYIMMICLHILGASLWIGGSFLFLFIILPQAVTSGDTSIYKKSVGKFLTLGFSALIAQLLTGIHLGMVKLPGFGNWFGFSHPYSHIIVTKLVLILVSLGVLSWIAIASKGDTSAPKVKWLPWVTLNILGILLLVTGVLFRTAI